MDEKPKTFITEQNFFKTEADAESALNVVYRGPQDRYGVALWGGAHWFEWATDECYLTTANSHAYHNEPSYLKTNFNASSAMPEGFWSHTFNHVKDVNFYLQQVNNVPMSDPKKDIGKAQARAIRALLYFDAVQIFGDLPLILTPETESKVLNAMSRTNKVDVYKSIETDLLYAMSILPNLWTGNDQGRISKGAAAGLLAKVYITWAGHPIKDETKYDEGRKLLENLIDKQEYGSQYALFSSYEEAFLEANIPGKESVWTINFTKGTFGQGSDMHTNNAPLELYYASGMGLTRGGGWSNGLPTEGFYNSYEANDDRFTFSWWTSTADIPSEYADVSPAISFSAPHCKKFREPTPNNNSLRNGIDHYVLRYADLLLLYAEVLNELGQDSKYDYINMVRNRAGLPGLSAMSQEQFREHMYNERAWELAFEGNRRFDLMRWGNYVERLKMWNTQAGPNAIKGKHELWPIPQREIDINSNLSQNEAY
ncbi:membrane protein [Bacteroidales bacterium]|nr:membrane protein [Bacteroidales bacterium]